MKTSRPTCSSSLLRPESRSSVPRLPSPTASWRALPAERSETTEGQRIPRAPVSAQEVPLSARGEEAAAAAGFTLATPSDASLPFQGAAVIHPSLWEGVLTPGLSGDDAGGALGSEMTSSTALFAAALAPPDAPVVVLRYGEGFGTVMVIETRMTDSRWTQMGAALGTVPMLGTPGAVGDHQAYRLATALGSMMFWHQGDLMVLVAGSVSVADLEAFAASIDE